MQVCNTCTSLALVCRVARRANQRLAPLREREMHQRRTAILDDVWAEIHTMTAQRAKNKSATAEPLQESEQGAACPPAISPKTSARPVYEHTCPFCNDTARSTVLSVPVDHRSACRHQFCVHAGSRFSSRAYEHACCTCGTIARRRTNSNKAQDPAGKTCRRKSWQSLVSLVACATQSESKLQPPGA